jgi:hypothetical protein
MRANRCDCCGEKFGLVTHGSWNRRFCCKPCKQVYRAKNSRLRRWAAWLASNAGRDLDRAMSMVPQRHWASQARNAGS